MNSNIEKAKHICELYKDGKSLTEIGKLYNHDISVITSYIKRYYERFYNIKPQSYKERKKEYLEELHNKYQETYAPHLHSRKEMCELLNCTPLNFELMLEEYNISHPRLQTYKCQKTLCNVPKEVFDEYKSFCEKRGWSVRKLACIAINNYILNCEE